MILEPEKVESATVSISSPSICHEVMGPEGQWLLVYSELYSHHPYLVLEHFCYPLPQET